MWSPYEQNTQQSPAKGRSTARHAGHSKKNTHASSGIVACSTCPHDGQVMRAMSAIPGSTPFGGLQ